jgi:hypothetical protein
MDVLESVVKQAILPFTRKHKYTLVTLSYWADQEDYYYAPIIVGNDDLLSIVVHEIQQADFQSQRRFVKTFHKKPKIVGAVILRRASGDEHNEAACRSLSRCLREYCLTLKVTPAIYVPKGLQLPRLSPVLCEGFDETEEQILLENLGPLVVQDLE